MNWRCMKKKDKITFYLEKNEDEKYSNDRFFIFGCIIRLTVPSRFDIPSLFLVYAYMYTFIYSLLLV